MNEKEVIKAIYSHARYMKGGATVEYFMNLPYSYLLEELNIVFDMAEKEAKEVEKKLNKK